MACEYCLNGNVSEEFRYCPKCGEHIGVVRGLQWIKTMADEALKVLNNCTKDENGNVIITEREPITVDHFELGRHPVKAFEPEKVDISRELIWMEEQTMSKILGKTKEVVRSTVRELDGIQCDRCKRVISPWQYGSNRKDSRYFEVTTGHNDWGSESIESIEDHDICPECLTDFINAYLKEENSDTAYINIKTELVYPRDIWE